MGFLTSQEPWEFHAKFPPRLIRRRVVVVTSTPKDFFTWCPKYVNVGL